MSAFERICLVGWGAIGRRVAQMLENRRDRCGIVSVGVRSQQSDRPELPPTATLITSPDELAATKPSLLVEAAGRESVLSWCVKALDVGVDVVITSTSALEDPEVLGKLIHVAELNNARILVPPGALGGMDALSAASRLGVDKVVHRIIKPASAWTNTAAESQIDLHNLTGQTVFYSGPASEAARNYPQNANVAVITSLAGIGLERTIVELVADAEAVRNVHEITAIGEFGTLHVRLENRPLKSNPKSSEMTALNLVRVIENRTATLVL